jgi:hypothetical protein
MPAETIRTLGDQLMIGIEIRPDGSGNAKILAKGSQPSKVDQDSGEVKQTPHSR